MWSAQLTRPDFVELLGRIDKNKPLINPPTQQRPNKSPKHDNLWVVWENNPSQGSILPNFIVVDDSVESDFFAWAASYLPSFRPISGLFRVLSWSQFAHLDFQRVIPYLHSIEGACIGAIIAESVLLFTERGKTETIEKIFPSTLSFAMSRVLGLYNDRDIVDAVAAGWVNSQSIVTGNTTNSINEELLKVWKVLASLRQQSISETNDDIIPLYKAAMDLSSFGQLDPSTWNDLSNNLDYAPVHRAMTDTKEERMRLLDVVSKELIHGRRQKNTSFTIGYLASMMSESSLAYIDYLLPLVEREPMILIWYAICSGLAGKSRFGNEHKLGSRRILRELERPFHLEERTIADLSISELRVLNRSKSRNKADLGMQSSKILVELWPGIVTEVWKDDINNELGKGRIHFDESIGRMNAVVSQLDRDCSRLQRTMRVLKDELNSSTRSNSRS